jgi:hypothetical protein
MRQPKLILPMPSRPKHMENESAVNPSLDNMLGTDIFSIPSPNKPLGAATSKNDPL